MNLRNDLRKLVTLKPKEEDKVESALVPAADMEVKKNTYYDSGYEAAQKANGSAIVLSSCLDEIFFKFKDICHKDLDEQKRLNAPYVAEQESLRTELRKRETLKSIKEEEVKEIDKKLNSKKNDIAQVRNNPDKYGLDASNKPQAQFWIGLVILLPITLYLLVFYVSASYSGFFKNFESSELSAAIFDANAFGKALQDGWLEAVFVCTIPFAFMGLGFLVHMFLKENKTGYVKVLLLYFTTFIFDAILAYLIEKKIYDFEKTLTSLPYDLKIAFGTVEFWGIIFAGFIVYIIWGLVFDLVMKEYENIDKIKMFIRSLKEEINELGVKKVEANTILNNIAHEITAMEGKVKELQSKIDGFIFPNRKYLLYHSEYMKGWFIAVSNEIALPSTSKDELLEKCNNVSKEHLDKHGIGNENHEFQIYKNNGYVADNVMVN